MRKIFEWAVERNPLCTFILFGLAIVGTYQGSLYLDVTYL